MAHKNKELPDSDPAAIAAEHYYDYEARFARGEEPRLSQRVREPTGLHGMGLLVEAGGRGADRPRSRDPARRAGPTRGFVRSPGVSRT